MNRKMIVWIIVIIFSIAIGAIAYRIVRKPKDNISLNEITKNIVQISEIEESKEDEVTDECINEWNDYGEYISERVEEANNNLSEQDTHYLLKDVYGYIEIYYLDENNNEYLYKKTDISTEYLSEEDINDLKIGIEVVGIEALNKMLEDFE